MRAPAGFGDAERRRCKVLGRRTDCRCRWHHCRCVLVDAYALRSLVATSSANSSTRLSITAVGGQGRRRQCPRFRLGRCLITDSDAGRFSAMRLIRYDLRRRVPPPGEITLRARRCPTYVGDDLARPSRPSVSARPKLGVASIAHAMGAHAGFLDSKGSHHIIAFISCRAAVSAAAGRGEDRPLPSLSASRAIRLGAAILDEIRTGLALRISVA